MAVSKFIMALFFTCLSLANSESFRNKPWEETEMVNFNEETDPKGPEQTGGGYYTGRCTYGCCYRGRNSCIGCCRYPHEKTKSVGMQQRGRGDCKYGCSGSYVNGQCTTCRDSNQVAQKAKEQEAFPVWTQGQP